MCATRLSTTRLRGSHFSGEATGSHRSLLRRLRGGQGLRSAPPHLILCQEAGLVSPGVSFPQVLDCILTAALPLHAGGHEPNDDNIHQPRVPLQVLCAGAQEPESNATGAGDGNRVWGALRVCVYLHVQTPMHTHTRTHTRTVMCSHARPSSSLAVPHATLVSRFSLQRWSAEIKSISYQGHTG